MWHDTQEIVSEPKWFHAVSPYTIWTTVITLQTPPVTHGPRASSVQVGCHITGCAFAYHMVNNADKGPRLVDISLVAIYFREKSSVGPSQVSRHAAVRTEPGMDRS